MTLTLNTILLAGMLTGFASGSGQNSTQAKSNTNSTAVESGVTVKKLSDSIWYIYQDKKNNLWFGSNGQGIFRYDGKTILNFTTKHGLCNDSVRQIQEDESGNMFFSTMGGINKFDGERFTTLQPIKSKDWKLEKNDLWFYMLGKRDQHGPYRYDGKNLYNLEFPKHFLHDEFHKKGINLFFSQ
jgi:ligand-binding sensor domain-containing protein